MLTEERIREVIGNVEDLDYAALAESANADGQEGTEWLPY